MGFYIETPKDEHKADQIIELQGASEIDEPKDFSEIPDGKALIIVVENGKWDAAFFAHDKHEFDRALKREIPDPRPKRFLLMDREAAELLTMMDGTPSYEKHFQPQSHGIIEWPLPMDDLDDSDLYLLIDRARQLNEEVMRVLWVRWKLGYAIHDGVARVLDKGGE